MSLKQDLTALDARLHASDRLPVLFLGHGSPMNALDETPYAASWRTLGQHLPRPQAILVVSAHWMTRGSTLVDISALPRTIHDFYGFPQALYEQQYPAPGAPELAQEVAAMLADHGAQPDDTWGLDHGAWAVLKFLYPEANVPVFQLSIDMDQDLAWHLALGTHLRTLRSRGVLILGSGNIVHNLPAMTNNAIPFDWAEAFDHQFSDRLEARDFGGLADRSTFQGGFDQAHPSVDHYLPALSVLGAARASDALLQLNARIDLGSVSMRSFVFY